MTPEVSNLGSHTHFGSGSGRPRRAWERQEKPVRGAIRPHEAQAGARRLGRAKACRREATRNPGRPNQAQESTIKLARAMTGPDEAPNQAPDNQIRLGRATHGPEEAPKGPGNHKQAPEGLGSYFGGKRGAHPFGRSRYRCRRVAVARPLPELDRG